MSVLAGQAKGPFRLDGFLSVAASDGTRGLMYIKFGGGTVCMWAQGRMREGFSRVTNL